MIYLESKKFYNRDASNDIAERRFLENSNIESSNIKEEPISNATNPINPADIIINSGENNDEKNATMINQTQIPLINKEGKQ